MKTLSFGAVGPQVQLLQLALERAKHQWDLETESTVTVNIDAVQMGVGGDDSWGARPHSAYMPGAGTYKLAFVYEAL